MDSLPRFKDSIVAYLVISTFLGRSSRQSSSVLPEGIRNDHVEVRTRCRKRLDNNLIWPVQHWRSSDQYSEVPVTPVFIWTSEDHLFHHTAMEDVTR